MPLIFHSQMSRGKKKTKKNSIFGLSIFPAAGRRESNRKTPVCRRLYLVQSTVAWEVSACLHGSKSRKVIKPGCKQSPWFVFSLKDWQRKKRRTRNIFLILKGWKPDTHKLKKEEEKNERCRNRWLMKNVVHIVKITKRRHRNGCRWFFKVISSSIVMETDCLASGARFVTGVKHTQTKTVHCTTLVRHLIPSK